MVNRVGGSCCFADAARVGGAAQTQTCRCKLVVSVNTSSDLRVRGCEQMTSYIHQRDHREGMRLFKPFILTECNKSECLYKGSRNHF